eukprot:1224356-Alexandrium_andersonii.AAC.1
MGRDEVIRDGAVGAATGPWRGHGRAREATACAGQGHASGLAGSPRTPASQDAGPLAMRG